MPALGARPATPTPFELRFRQVHLDFHTSQHVKGIAADFDPGAFVATLKQARVDSVTCFGRCHHGYIYYDTKKFPERRHPHLTRNLLKEQIDACHKADIRVPIYLTVEWDQFTADRHPDWRRRTEDGGMQGTPTDQPGFYRHLCLNSPYVKTFLEPHIAELFEVVPVDGLFLDIVKSLECWCSRCVGAMTKRGQDPKNPAVRRAFARETAARFRNDLSAFIRKLDRKATIFYNGGHVGPEFRPGIGAFTHLELESLPSGGWGYLHFPLTMRYARTLGQDALGMTGKFHTAWGDFHSLKNRAALEFECFQMLALGGKCSIGDQLHPSGKLDAATYDLIGSVYGQVAKKEAFCRGARAVVDIGVLSAEEFTAGEARTPAAMRGVVRMLQEGAHQFDVVDSHSDYSRYRVLILVDDVTVDAKLQRKLAAYVARGGAILAAHKAAAGPFGEKVLGARVKGDAPFSPDYVRPRKTLAAGLPANTELVMYTQGVELQPLAGTAVLADVIAPYFNRTAEHYFSHKHTPSSGKVAYPGVVQRGRTITFAHPVFAQYAKNAPLWCKRLVLNALDLLLPEPTLRLKAPSATLSAVNEQPKQRRWVVHLLHYVPERRGDDFDVIEDVIPIENVELSLRVPRGVRGVTLAPEGTPLAWKANGKRIDVTVPRLLGHQMIALELA